MKYLKQFKTNADYQAFKKGDDWATPNVSAIENDDTIFYEPIKSTLITFTVGDVEYQAEEGMTWKEWCNSEYNTAGFIYDWTENGDGIYTSDYKKYFIFGLNDTSLVTTGVYLIKTVGWPLL